MIQELVLFLAGIVVGSMNAIAGGGTLVGFPVMLAIGMPALAANATSHLAVLPGLLASAYGYRNHLRKLKRRYLVLVIPFAAGGIIGAIILRNTSAEQFQKIVPALVLFAVVLFASQPLLHFHLHRHMRSKSKALQPLVLISLAMLPVAIYGGYFGAGFGFLMLAFLGFTKIHEIHQMNAIKSVGGAIVAVTSLATLTDTGLINWKYGLIMSIGCAIGGYYGAVLSQKVSSHAIRIIVIAIGLTTAIYIGLRGH